jgi:hypothetical protein
MVNAVNGREYAVGFDRRMKLFARVAKAEKSQLVFRG